MENVYTISCHNGSQVSPEHNRRDRRVTDKEKHIDPNGEHEIWLDYTSIGDVYDEIFAEAVEDYNAKQKQKCRRTTTREYLAKCTPKKKSKEEKLGKNGKKKRDNDKKPCYEMIVGIYGKTPKLDENGNQILDVNGFPVTEEMLDPAVGKEILREFIRDWPKRNPNLKLIGVYYHADEQGAPHIHVDYIPIARGYGWGMDVDELRARGVQGVSDSDRNAHGYKNGMALQNAMQAAIYEQGTYVDENLEVQHLFKSNGMKDTCQIQWQESERMYLDGLCAQRGIEVVHPRTGDKHLDTATYQKVQDMIREGRREAEKERSEIISQAHDEASKVHDDAEDLLVKARTVLEDAQSQSEVIVADAQGEGERIKTEIIQEANAMAGETVDNARQEASSIVKEARNKAFKEMRAASAEAKAVKAEADDYREKTAEALRKREERLKDPEKAIRDEARAQAEPIAERLAEPIANELANQKAWKYFRKFRDEIEERIKKTAAGLVWNAFRAFTERYRIDGKDLYREFVKEHMDLAMTYDPDTRAAVYSEMMRERHDRSVGHGRDDFDDPNQEHELGGNHRSPWE